MPSLTVRRYRVLDEIPPNTPGDRFIKGIRAHSFLPLDPQRTESDVSVGWVTTENGDDADLSTSKVFFQDQLRVTMRIDSLKVPAAEVKKRLRAESQELEEQEGRPITKRERALLKEGVKRSVRLQSFTASKLVPMVWDLEQRRIYLHSQSKGINETFVELFLKSFGVRIDIEGPGFWAATLLGLGVKSLAPTPELWTGFEGLRPKVVTSEG